MTPIRHKPAIIADLSQIASEICNIARLRISFCKYMAELGHTFTYADLVGWCKAIATIPEMSEACNYISDPTYTQALDKATGGTRIMVSLDPSSRFTVITFFLSLLDAQTYAEIPTLQQQLLAEAKQAELDLATYLPFADATGQAVTAIASRQTAMLDALTAERDALIDIVPGYLKQAILRPISIDFYQHEWPQRSYYNQVSTQVLEKIALANADVMKDILGGCPKVV